MVFFGIGIPFEVDEFKASAIGHCPGFLLLVVLGAELGEELLGSGDNFSELGEFAPDENPDRPFAVVVGVLEPIPNRGLSLAPAPRAAVEDFEDRAGQEGCLRTLLGLPDDGLLGFCHGGIRFYLIIVQRGLENQYVAGTLTKRILEIRTRIGADCVRETIERRSLI